MKMNKGFFSGILVFGIIILLVSLLFPNIYKEISSIYGSYKWIFIIILLYTMFFITLKSRERHYFLRKSINNNMCKYNTDKYDNYILKLSISDGIDIIQCISFGYIIAIFLISKMFNINSIITYIWNSTFLMSLICIIISCLIWEIINYLTYLFIKYSKNNVKYYLR